MKLSPHTFVNKIKLTFKNVPYNNNVRFYEQQKYVNNN